MGLLSKLGGRQSGKSDGQICGWMIMNINKGLTSKEIVAHVDACPICGGAMAARKKKEDKIASKANQHPVAAWLIAHIIGLVVGVWVVLVFLDGQRKPGFLVTALGVGIWWGVASIMKNYLTYRSTLRKPSLETTKNIKSDGSLLNSSHESISVLLSKIVNHVSIVPGAESKQEAQIAKIIDFGQGVIPNIKAAIVSVKTGDNAAKFENAGRLCEAIGKIGGEKAFRILKEFAMNSSNIAEYRYIRIGAARGLVYLSSVDARADALLPDLANSYGIGDEINQVLHSTGGQPKESWDALANSFVVTDLPSESPDYEKLAARLIGFTAIKRHGAWVILAEALLKMKRKEEAMKCYVEALYNYPGDDSVVWGWLNGNHGDGGVDWLSPNAPKTKETVEALRTRLGSILDNTNTSATSVSS